MYEENKLMIEQCLYGIYGDKNTLSGEDYLLEMINKYLDSKSPDYTLSYLLTESIEFNPDLNKYSALIEAADAVKEVENNINKDSKNPDNVCKKLTESMKKMVKWYYKIDPESKAKSFRIVMNVLYKVAVFAISWKFGMSAVVGTGIKTAMNAGTKFLGKNIATKINDITNKDSENYNKYFDGASDVYQKTSGTVKVKFMNNTASIPLAFIAVNFASSLLSTIDQKVYYMVNKEDVEENLEKYEKLLADLRDKASKFSDENKKTKEYKSIQSSIKKTSDAVKELRKIKTIKDNEEY